jgi:hypothetical protein
MAMFIEQGVVGMIDEGMGNGYVTFIRTSTGWPCSSVGSFNGCWVVSLLRRDSGADFGSISEVKEGERSDALSKRLVWTLEW